jgi:hypothetical protein
MKAGSRAHARIGHGRPETMTLCSRTWGQGANSVAVQSFEWCFDRLSLAQSRQFWCNVNPPIATLARVSFRFGSGSRLQTGRPQNQVGALRAAGVLPFFLLERRHVGSAPPHLRQPALIGIIRSQESAHFSFYVVLYPADCWLIVVDQQV